MSQEIAICFVLKRRRIPTKLFIISGPVCRWSLSDWFLYFTLTSNTIRSLSFNGSGKHQDPFSSLLAPASRICKNCMSFCDIFALLRLSASSNEFSLSSIDVWYTFFTPPSVVFRHKVHPSTVIIAKIFSESPRITSWGANATAQSTPRSIPTGISHL